MIVWLVVWNIIFIFPYIGNVIIPTDELIFFRGVGIPPTSVWLTNPSRLFPLKFSDKYPKWNCLIDLLLYIYLFCFSGIKSNFNLSQRLFVLDLVVEVLLQKELNLRSGHKPCTMNCWVYGFHIKWFQQLFFLKHFCKNIPDSPRIKNWMLASCPILFLSCCPRIFAVFANHQSPLEEYPRGYGGKAMKFCQLRCAVRRKILEHCHVSIGKIEVEWFV